MPVCLYACLMGPRKYSSFPGGRLEVPGGGDRWQCRRPSEEPECEEWGRQLWRHRRWGNLQCCLAQVAIRTYRWRALKVRFQFSGGQFSPEPDNSEADQVPGDLWWGHPEPCPWWQDHLSGNEGLGEGKQSHSPRSGGKVYHHLHQLKYQQALLVQNHCSFHSSLTFVNWNDHILIDLK